jgi:aspartyl-tRNA(Asn)/glutamyl-tRNA(Gln) amidotransferase subunit A
VEDCATLFAVLTGPRGELAGDIDDAGLVHLDTDLRGVRIGVVRNFFDGTAPVSEDLVHAVDAALRVFIDAGCGVVDVNLRSVEDWNAVGMVILLAEAFALHTPWLRNRIDRYGDSFSDAVLLGAALKESDYFNAVQARRLLTAELDVVMDSCDLLIAPIQPDEAMPLSALSKWGFLERPSYGIPFNVSDNPALSVCCGFGRTGLPLALQVVGRPGGEASVLRAGHAYQMRCDWQTKSRCIERLLDGLG